jgi:hypothetical protein
VALSIDSTSLRVDYALLRNQRMQGVGFTIVVREAPKPAIRRMRTRYTDCGRRSRFRPLA